MKTVSAKHFSVRNVNVLMPTPGSPANRSPRSESRTESTATYLRLNAAYDHYTHDMPEDSFPSFLESLFLEPLVEDGILESRKRISAARGGQSTTKR
jgi:hypothetical protein